MGKTDKHRASKFLQWGAVAFFAIYFAFRGVGLWASMVLGAKAILGAILGVLASIWKITNYILALFAVFVFFLAYTHTCIRACAHNKFF